MNARTDFYPGGIVEVAPQLRVPPHSLEAEHSVLGGLLIDNQAFDRVADLLVESDFYRPEHRPVYSAIGRLVSSGKPADVVTVYDSLQADGKAAECGGLEYLNRLAQCVPSASNVRRYAEIVRERSVMRSIIGKVDEAGVIAFGDGSFADKLDRIGALFYGIDQRNSRRKPRPMSEVVIQVIDGINAAAEGNSPAWRTGIPGIDSRLSGGMRPGKLIILAARPGVGKSSLAKQVAKRAASDDLPALFLSQEMEADELGERSLANEAQVNYSAIQTGKLNDLEWGRLAEGVERLARIPLWIDDEPGLTIRAIASKARSIKGLKVLVVDYVQLSEGEGDTRSAQVGSITRGLKKLAKELGICVIALSQLNREIEKRPGRRPQMADLRDSGEIEQDADTIVFLWPLQESEDGAEVRHIGCEIAKNRKGRKGSFVLIFDAARQTWRESDQPVDAFGPGKQKGRFE